jgi:hypothetical protein
MGRKPAVFTIGDCVMGLCAERVRALLDYSPETGVFTWRSRPREDFSSVHEFSRWNSRYADTVAGSVGKHGYRSIKIDRAQYKAHRIAWIYMVGHEPNNHIDHTNGMRDDNRWENLRDVPRMENNKNAKKRSDNSSGVQGVSWQKRMGKWAAQIGVFGKQTHLGYFDSIEDAAGARRRAQQQYGYHEHHGRPA